MLNALKVSLEFTNAPLPEVLDSLRQVSGIDFVIDPNVQARFPADSLAITIKVKDLPLRSALRLVLGSKNLTAVYRHGVLLVVTRDEAEQHVVLRYYDVRDLLMKIEDSAGPAIELVPPGQKTGGIRIEIEPEKSPRIPPEFMVDLIQKSCGATSWTQPKASIKLQNGLLIVNQTPRVHAEIAELIGLLRQYR